MYQDIMDWKILLILLGYQIIEEVCRKIVIFFHSISYIMFLFESEKYISNIEGYVCTSDRCIYFFW